MKQTVDADDPKHPRGNANRSRTTLSGHADALPINLIVVPRADFTTAMVRRSRSPFSLCTSRSKADKLEAARHHREASQGGRKKRMERRFFLSVCILEILRAFYRRDLLVGAIDLANKTHL
jgi:hypothetical protein